VQVRFQPRPLAEGTVSAVAFLYNFNAAGAAAGAYDIVATKRHAVLANPHQRKSRIEPIHAASV
jgi:hypothetical protein